MLNKTIIWKIMKNYFILGLFIIIALNVYYLIDIYNFINKRFMLGENVFLCPQCRNPCDKSNHDYYGNCRSRWCSSCKVTFLETQKYI